MNCAEARPHPPGQSTLRLSTPSPCARCCIIARGPAWAGARPETSCVCVPPPSCSWSGYPETWQRQHLTADGREPTSSVSCHAHTTDLEIKSKTRSTVLWFLKKLFSDSGSLLNNPGELRYPTKPKVGCVKSFWRKNAAGIVVCVCVCVCLLVLPAGAHTHTSHSLLSVVWDYRAAFGGYSYRLMSQLGLVLQVNIPA